jgi:chemotaxis protein MotA
MLDTLAALYDPAAFAFVGMGTIVATWLRCGGTAISLAFACVWNLGRGFDAAHDRADFARLASAVGRKGALCAEASLSKDADSAMLAASVLRGTSPAALESQIAAQIARRLDHHDTARGVLAIGGELAPVFGLAGTLLAVALAIPDPASVSPAATMAAVGSAVVSSLYGIALAHLVLFPLERAIARNHACEEQARAETLAWFSQQIATPAPRRSGGDLKEAA